MTSFMAILLVAALPDSGVERQAGATARIVAAEEIDFADMTEYPTEFPGRFRIIRLVGNDARDIIRLIEFQ